MTKASQSSFKLDLRSKPILVTGATGYVGSRLVQRLLDAGYTVRAVSRSEAKLRGRIWANHKNLEIVSADLLDQNSIKQAATGCSASYYLVHSMNLQQKDFAEADRRAAQNMVIAAEQADLKRIIYLGGLGEKHLNLSNHLRSRAEVAEILRAGKVPVTVFRAAMIIGSGSASFEILRYLVDRLPIMITPQWVRTPSQPIAIRNVLEYLVGCLEKDQTIAETFDIGGTKVITYQDLMDMYAEEAGLKKRLVIPVPFFTPRLSSYWIHFVTPIPAYLARPLTEGLRNPAVCMENNIRTIIPVQLLEYRTAIRLAIARTQHQDIESHWTDAGKMPPDEWCKSGDSPWAGGTAYEDKRQITIAGTADDFWNVLVHLGGKTGWYYGNWLWKIRGALDKLIGGIGLTRGRRNESTLLPGDVLDFWRILWVEPKIRLLLIAEMKLPGKAMLEFRIRQIEDQKTELQQTARFLPSGVSGIAYWIIISPLHNIIFNGLLKGIAQATKKSLVSGPETRK